MRSEKEQSMNGKISKSNKRSGVRFRSNPDQNLSQRL